MAAGIPAATNRRGEKSVWQRRFWGRAIRDEDDWRNHVDDVHYNPVKHDDLRRLGDWRWSSFQRARQRGWYPPEWGGVGPGKSAGYGVRMMVGRAEPLRLFHPTGLGRRTHRRRR
jgi:putative transposase